MQQSPEQVHAKRITAAIHWTSITLIMIGMSWTVLLIYYNAWQHIWMEAIVAGIGLLGYVLNVNGHTRSAAYLLLTSLLVVISAMSFFIDIPNGNAPRSVHNYLLPIALLSYLLLTNDKKWIRVSAVSIFLTAYLVFSSTLIGFIPDIIAHPSVNDVRVVGAWVNNVCAIGLTGLILYIIFSSFALKSQMERDLSVALLSSQFELNYQPQVDEQGCIWGAEALLRWHHPIKGVVMPQVFISLAEQTGLIVLIGRWVLDRACQQLSVWAANVHTAQLTLSVNISAQEFYEDDFIANTLSTIEKTGIDASKLKLEITESLLIQNVDEVVNKMAALKSHGVGFSLDDFGTGFSSLNYLKRLPLDQLKIDRSFVSEMAIKSKDEMIVRAIISLGHDLELNVIAEGVETEQQRQFLLENKCSLFQGYLFSHPLPIDEFNVLVKA